MTTRRNILIPSDGWVTQEADQLFEVFLATMRPEVMAMELQLLADDLVSELSLRHPGSPLRVHLTMATTPFRAIASVKPYRLEIALSPTEVGYWQSFFLKYYRDEFAEVDHIDLEAVDSQNHKRVIDLRLKVGLSAPPVDADEARRRFGQ